MSKSIAITLGDPVGIGPDICVMMADQYIKSYHIVITDPELLIASARKLKKNITINKLKSLDDSPLKRRGVINVVPVKLIKKK